MLVMYAGIYYLAFVETGSVAWSWYEDKKTFFIYCLLVLLVFISFGTLGPTQSYNSRTPGNIWDWTSGEKPYTPRFALQKPIEISSKNSGLPEELTALIGQVETSKTDYPDRASDIGSMNDYIANGNFEMAAFVANNIIKQQVAVGRFGSSLPAELTALIGQIEAGKTDYPDRASDIRSMKDYIANGNFEMAAFVANNIIKQQNNLISSMNSGLPAELTSLIGQVETSKTDYPDRASDIGSMKGYIANGNFEMAAFVANNIIKQQVAVGRFGSSLPAELSALIRQSEAGKTDYPDRASDIRSMKGYIANGNFEMAAFVANNIIKQQNTLISSMKNGLPSDLTALIRQVEASKTDYPDRTSDIRSMKGYIANGNFEMAAFVANNIIKQQSNLR